MTGTIERVEAFEANLPLPEPLILGELYIPNRVYTFVRVYDADGRFGTGFALSRNAPVAATVERAVAPHWTGKPLDDHAAVYAKTVRSNAALGTNGIFWRALSLTENAVYDLLAQRAGKTLCDYLGGELRTVPTYLVGGYPFPDETPDKLKDEMRELVGLNPAGIKIGSSGDPVKDTGRLAACREVVPEEKPLSNDLHWGAPDAHVLLPEAQKWDQFNMGWLEDPYHFDDITNVRALADGLPYPVAVGDEQTGQRHFTRLMDDGHIGVVRLDATVCGGVRTFLQIAAMAHERDLKVATHVYHHLHAQLAAVIPNILCIEAFVPDSGLDSIDLVWNTDLEWRDGGLQPSTTPGVGYDWNEDALREYRVE